MLKNFIIGAFGWAFGLIFVFLGLMLLTQKGWAPVPLFIIAALLLPPSIRYINNSNPQKPPLTINEKTITIIVMLIVAMYLLPPTTVVDQNYHGPGYDTPASTIVDKINEPPVIEDPVVIKEPAVIKKRARVKAEPVVIDYEARINKLDPYTKKNDPKAVKWAGKRLAQVEAMRKKAAIMAIDGGKCDRVFMSELSTNDGGPKDLRFFVSCNNNTMVRLTEAEIEKGGLARSEEEKAWKREDAIPACHELIKAHVKWPNTVDTYYFTGVDFRLGEGTFNAVVRYEFDVITPNAAKFPFTAYCYFRPGEESGSIEVKQRN